MFPANTLDKTVLTHIRPDNTSGLIWILTVCLAGGIPERIYFEKKVNLDDEKVKILHSIQRFNCVEYVFYRQRRL